MSVNDISESQTLSWCQLPTIQRGLFYQIEQEPEDTCLYKRLKLNYHYDLGKIYTEEEIEKAKLSHGFDREFGLQYLDKTGNVFSSLQIDKVIELGEQYSMDKMAINHYTIHSIGVDPGFSSSRFAIVVTEFLKEEEKIRVVYSEEFEKSRPGQGDIQNVYHRLWHDEFIHLGR